MPAVINALTLSSTASLKFVTADAVILTAVSPAAVNCPCAFTVKFGTVAASP